MHYLDDNDPLKLTYEQQLLNLHREVSEQYRLVSRPEQFALGVKLES